MEKISNYFNIKRFGQVLKCDFVGSWRYLAVLAGILVLTEVPVLAFPSVEQDFSTIKLHNFFAIMYVVTLALSILDVFFINSMVFNNFQREKLRLRTLVTPASLAEKVVSRLVVFWLLPWMLFSVFLCMQYSSDLLPNDLHSFCGAFHRVLILMIVSSFVVLGNAAVRKMGSVVGIAWMLALVYFGVSIKNHINFLWFVDIDKFGHQGYSNLFWVIAAVSFVVIAVNFVISGILLSRKTIR